MASLDDILPTAKDCLKKSAEMEAEKAAEYMRRSEGPPKRRRRNCWTGWRSRPACQRRRADEARRRHHQSRGQQRTDRSRSRPLSRTSCSPTRAAPSISRSRAGRKR